MPSEFVRIDWTGSFESSGTRMDDGNLQDFIYIPDSANLGGTCDAPNSTNDTNMDGPAEQTQPEEPTDASTRVQRYQLSLSAKDLSVPSCLPFQGAPSPYAVVEVTGGPQEGTVLGQTETIAKTSNPDWCEIVFLETSPAIHMPLRVSIFHRHHDDSSLEPRLIGSADFEATSVHQSTGKNQTAKIGRKGKLIVHIEESFIGELRGKMKIQFRGLDMKNVEPGPFGLGRSDPFFEISKKNADHEIAASTWNVVYRSEYIKNNLNPYWNPTVIDVEKLCFGKENWPLLVSVWDHSSKGKHELIGQFETNIPHLRSRLSIKGNADRDQAILLADNAPMETGRLSRSTTRVSKTVGLLVVLKAELFEDETM